MNYNDRVRANAEKLARINVAEMAQMAKYQGITSTLGGDYDNWTENAKKSAVGAHINRAKAAVAEQAEAIRHFGLTYDNKIDVEKFLLDNGYTEVP